MSCPNIDVRCTCPCHGRFSTAPDTGHDRFSTAPTKKEKYWLAVFGAFVAAQAHKKLESGQGMLFDDDMDRFVAEAETVATLAVEAVERSSRA